MATTGLYDLMTTEAMTAPVPDVRRGPVENGFIVYRGPPVRLHTLSSGRSASSIGTRYRSRRTCR